MEYFKINILVFFIVFTILLVGFLMITIKKITDFSPNGNGLDVDGTTKSSFDLSKSNSSNQTDKKNNLLNVAAEVLDLFS
tara:strand:+ start:1789 stop:2028 length:240 start_codon:yes stop_codon:yes gene_type:complete